MTERIDLDAIEAKARAVAGHSGCAGEEEYWVCYQESDLIDSMTASTVLALIALARTAQDAARERDGLRRALEQAADLSLSDWSARQIIKAALAATPSQREGAGEDDT